MECFQRPPSAEDRALRRLGGRALPPAGEGSRRHPTGCRYGAGEKIVLLFPARSSEVIIVLTDVDALFCLPDVCSRGMHGASKLSRLVYGLSYVLVCSIAHGLWCYTGRRWCCECSNKDNNKDIPLPHAFATPPPLTPSSCCPSR